MKCWTGGPGVQVDPTDNVVSLGDRYGPVIRLGSRRVLTDEQCVDLREQILSTVKAVGDGADLLVNKYQDERKFARIGLRLTTRISRSRKRYVATGTKVACT